MRVLIADSDVVKLQDHLQYLRQRGLQAFAASDGLECLAKLREHRPDVLVLDPDLPWGGGDGVLDRMNSDSDLPLTTVIVLISIHAPNQIDRIAKFPIHELRFKPLSSPELFESILKYGRTGFKNYEQFNWINAAILARKAAIASEVGKLSFG